MKKRILSFLMIFCLIATLVPAVAAETPAVTVTASGTQNYAEAQEVLSLVNQNRAQAGAKALTHNKTLCELAMQRAAEIAMYYSHTRPNGTSCFTIMDGVYRYTTAGENIALGQTDAADVMDAWMHSEGHRKNILNGNFTQIGIGCFETNGIRTWVQLFGNSNDTETTECTDTVQIHNQINILPNLLDPLTTGHKNHEMKVGEDFRFKLIHRNTCSDHPGISSVNLIPGISNAVDANGTTVAKVTCDLDGAIRIHAVAAGSADVTFPRFANDPQPLTIHLTVTGGSAPDPEVPTEPSVPDPNPAGPTHSVSLRYTEGGTASVSTDRAKEGDTVTLTYAPDEGYFFDRMIIRTNGSYTPEYRSVDGSTIEIQMPDGDLELEVYFNNKKYCPFRDVKSSNYFYDAVLWAVENGITAGVDSTHFGSNQPCTRAQVVTFLWSAAGKPAPKSGSNPFSDVKAGDYFYDAVLWAVENGITAGVDSTHFGSNQTCTRAQVVTFLWSAAGKPDPKSGSNPFSDVKAADYFYNAVLWAVENGITAGEDATHFGPASTCTRAQVVTFLYKDSQR